MWVREWVGECGWVSECETWIDCFNSTKNRNGTMYIGPKGVVTPLAIVCNVLECNYTTSEIRQSERYFSVEHYKT